MKKLLLSIFLASVSMSVVGATGITTITKITKIYTYGSATSFHKDIVVEVETPKAECLGGFWVKATDTDENKNISSFLLSAFHSSSNVYFGAYTDIIWSGSSKKNYCQIHTVGLTK